MPISDIYTARTSGATGTGGFTVNSTSALALMSLWGGTAKRIWVVGVRAEIGTTTAVAGNNVLFYLARVSTTTATTTTIAGIPHDLSSSASQGNFATTWSTAPATVTAVLWEQQLPQTTGSAWEEFPPLGYEWVVPVGLQATASAGVHVFALASVSTNTPAYVDLIWSE